MSEYGYELTPSAVRDLESIAEYVAVQLCAKESALAPLNEMETAIGHVPDPRSGSAGHGRVAGTQGLQEADHKKLHRVLYPGSSGANAINVFLQQSMNAGGLPFVVTQNSKEALRDQAIAQFMSELQAGRDSVQRDGDWISEEDMRARLGVKR